MRYHACCLTAALCLTASTVAAAQSFEGEIKPLNAAKTGQSPSGTVTLAHEGGELSIEMTAKGLKPGMHLAHLHGFAEEDPREARCPTDEADVNDDGYVDLLETRETSGVTMIPLTADPASLKIHAETYAKADEDGRAAYRQTVDMAALEAAVSDTFGSPVAPARRVLYIHGVPEDSDLPDSVQSLEGVPAHVTLPIACAEIEPAGD